MPAAGLVTAGVIGLGEAAIGLINSSKAKKRAAELNATRPKLTESPYLQDALSLSESELSTGMSTDAKTAYEEDMDRGLSSSLGASIRMGGSPNNVAEIYASDQQGRARLAMMRDQIRMTNLNRLIQVQTQKEDDREKDFQFDQWMPWADEAQANAQAKETAQSEIFSGVSTAAGGFMRFGESAAANKGYGDYFKSPVTTQRIPVASPAPSPARTVSSIDPNSAPSLIDQLLAPDNS